MDDAVKTVARAMSAAIPKGTDIGTTISAALSVVRCGISRFPKERRIELYESFEAEIKLQILKDMERNQ